VSLPSGKSSFQPWRCRTDSEAPHRCSKTNCTADGHRPKRVTALVEHGRRDFDRRLRICAAVDLDRCQIRHYRSHPGGPVYAVLPPSHFKSGFTRRLCQRRGTTFATEWVVPNPFPKISHSHETSPGLIRFNYLAMWFFEKSLLKVKASAG
jgi:hypothetical protein